MREIKFRAWEFSTETMWAPFSVGVGGITPNKLFHIMQYTGLKDKDGKEIYEGDIVRGTFYANQPEISAIEWFDNLAGFTFSKYPMNIHGLHGLEIIGNIYKNPELVDNSE